MQLTTGRAEGGSRVDSASPENAPCGARASSRELSPWWPQPSRLTPPPSRGEGRWSAAPSTVPRRLPKRDPQPTLPLYASGAVTGPFFWLREQAQRGEDICPRSHRQRAAEAGSTLGTPRSSALGWNPSAGTWSSPGSRQGCPRLEGGNVGGWGCPCREEGPWPGWNCWPLPLGGAGQGPHLGSKGETLKKAVGAEQSGGEHPESLPRAPRWGGPAWEEAAGGGCGHTRCWVRGAGRTAGSAALEGRGLVRAEQPAKPAPGSGERLGAEPVLMGRPQDGGPGAAPGRGVRGAASCILELHPEPGMFWEARRQPGPSGVRQMGTDPSTGPGHWQEQDLLWQLLPKN